MYIEYSRFTKEKGSCRRQALTGDVRFLLEIYPVVNVVVDRKTHTLILTGLTPVYMYILWTDSESQARQAESTIVLSTNRYQESFNARNLHSKHPISAAYHEYSASVDVYASPQKMNPGRRVAIMAAWQPGDECTITHSLKLPLR